MCKIIKKVFVLLCICFFSGCSFNTAGNDNSNSPSNIPNPGSSDDNYPTFTTEIEISYDFKKQPVDKKLPSDFLLDQGFHFAQNFDEVEEYLNSRYGILDEEELNSYKIQFDKFTIPTVTDELGEGTVVSLNCNDNDVSLYYVLNFDKITDINTEKSITIKYENPFEVNGKQQIKIIARKTGYKDFTKFVDITLPYNRELAYHYDSYAYLNNDIIGNGISDILIVYSALEDLSGPDFSKQHYIWELDDGNCTAGDGISYSLTFDSTTQVIWPFDNQNENCKFIDDKQTIFKYNDDIIWLKDIYKQSIFENDCCLPFLYSR